MECEPVVTNATPGSFRDPAGRLHKVGGRFLRIVNKSGLADIDAFLSLPGCRTLFESGMVARTRFLDAGEQARVLLDYGVLVGAEECSAILEHEPVPFQSFPYEWPPDMLHAAASLTLDLAESLLGDGFGLKDATPYNVLFRGPEPVFVDLMSFERRTPGDPIWLPYGQFVRTFLLPMAVNKYFGTGLDQILSVRRDGLEPEEVYALCGPVRRLFPPFLSLASIPTWLGGAHKQESPGLYRARTSEPGKARFILESLFKRLRRRVNHLQPSPGKRSAWSDYSTTNSHYSDEGFRLKHSFVEEALDEFKPKRVLDIGCNTGHFSRLAAGRGSSAVAIDRDPVVVGETWRVARSEGLDVLPLVVDVTRPSPGTGWRNNECPAFLERARGAFDAVLMLALIHHLLVSERVPLEEIIDLAAELTSDILIIEFIAPHDSMFRRITRGRDQLFVDLTAELFEDKARRRFDIVRSTHLAGTSRRLYLLRKKR